MNLLDLFDLTLKGCAGETSLGFRGRQQTYGELDANSNLLGVSWHMNLGTCLEAATQLARARCHPAEPADLGQIAASVAGRSG